MHGFSCAHTTEKAFRGNVESTRCVLLQTDVPVAEHQDRSMEHKTHRKHQQSCHALTETSNLCGKSTHRRLPSKPLIERCSLFHGPPLPGSTSTQARTMLLLQLCKCKLRYSCHLQDLHLRCHTPPANVLRSTASTFQC